MKRTATTILATITLVFLTLTCLLFLVTLLGLVTLASPKVLTAHLLIERALFLITRVTILGTALCMFLRVRWVWLFLVLTFLFAAADAIVYAWWFLAPLPPGLSPAATAGRWAGRSVALLGPFVLYCTLFAYLLLPGTRAEFGLKGESQ